MNTYNTTRPSWTTKTDRALVCETVEEAAAAAYVRLGYRIRSKDQFVWSSAEHGYVIYNDAGTKMLTDGPSFRASDRAYETREGAESARKIQAHPCNWYVWQMNDGRWHVSLMTNREV